MVFAVRLFVLVLKISLLCPLKMEAALYACRVRTDFMPFKRVYLPLTTIPCLSKLILHTCHTRISFS
jgi:hypothetical protein